MNDLSDPLLRLLEKIASEDQGAVRQLYDLTSSKLFGVILRILKRHDIAEEVCQDVYITIWEQAKNYDSSKGRAISWMTAIARNRAIDVLRSREEKIVRSAVDGDFSDEMVSSLAQFSGGAPDLVENITLNVCLGEIEQTPRECVLLAYQYGLSRDELATRYDVPTSTVKTWIRRALISLKTCLER